MTQGMTAVVFGVGMLGLGLIVAAIAQGFIGFIAMLGGIILLAVGVSAAMSSHAAAPARGRI